MKLFIVTIILGLGLTSQAATVKHMFFYCAGNDKSNTALQVASDYYYDGQIRGVFVKIKGFYEEYHDEEMKESQMVIMKQARYTPRNPKLAGLEKYIIKTRKGASISLMIPSRTELEKQWEGVNQSRGPGKHNDFTGYVQLTDHTGDGFTQLEMRCNLNWQPSR